MIPLLSLARFAMLYLASAMLVELIRKNEAASELPGCWRTQAEAASPNPLQENGDSIVPDQHDDDHRTARPDRHRRAG